MKKRICFVELTGQGGIHQYSAKYIDKLAEMNYNAILITSKNSEIALKHAQKYEIEPYTGIYKLLFKFKKLIFKRHNKKNLKSNKDKEYIFHQSIMGTKFLWKKIIRILKKEKIDILHIQWIWDYYDVHLEYLEKIKKMGINIFFTFHNSIPHNQDGEIIINFYTKLNRYIKLFFTHSYYDKNIVETRYKIEKSKVHVLPMINVLTFNNTKKWNENHLILLFFGYIREYKGLKEFLKLLDKRRDFYLKIYGNSDENTKNELKKIINENNLKPIIEYSFNYVDKEKIPKIFEDVDYLILPYKSATQSALIPMSYMLKTPVIVYDVGGLAELVKDKNTGFIVEKPFEENFIKLDNKELKKISKRLSKQAYDYYNKELNIDKIIKKYLSFLT